MDNNQQLEMLHWCANVFCRSAGGSIRRSFMVFFTNNARTVTPGSNAIHLDILVDNLRGAGPVHSWPGLETGSLPPTRSL